MLYGHCINAMHNDTIMYTRHDPSCHSVKTETQPNTSSHSMAVISGATIESVAKKIHHSEGSIACYVLCVINNLVGDKYVDEVFYVCSRVRLCF